MRTFNYIFERQPLILSASKSKYSPVSFRLMRCTPEYVASNAGKPAAKHADGTVALRSPKICYVSTLRGRADEGWAMYIVVGRYLHLS